MTRNNNEHVDVLGSIPATGLFRDIISYCLQLLNTYRASTMIYILACLCPDDFAVLELVRFDLSEPHQHKQLPHKDIHHKFNTYADLLAHLRAYTSIVPKKDYPLFWLELTKSWLLTCPIDPS